jgi:hypothetical protein
MTQQVPPEWHEQLDTLLMLLQDEPGVEDEGRLADQLAGLDHDLVAFVIERVREQETPEAAAFLELLAGQTGLPDALRAQARAALATLVAQGVKTAAPPVGTERFLAGYVQRCREQGEQILLLGWRLPGGDIEALIFLLDWRGDGLKDFYATRHLADAEWLQLIEHNSAKGAPLVEVTLAEGRALLEGALAESRRYSRPLPREYKLTQGTIARRVLEAEGTPTAARSYLTPDLAAGTVVSTYVAALHFRDYPLAAELLAAEHPLRAGRSLEETADALRVEQKALPRRAEEVQVTPATEQVSDPPDGRSVLDAFGALVAVERTGKRVRTAIRERYMLTRHGDRWAILAIERT